MHEVFLFELLKKRVSLILPRPTKPTDWRIGLRGGCPKSSQGLKPSHIREMSHFNGRGMS